MPTWDFIVGNTSQSSALLKFLADNWIALLAVLAALGSFLVSYQIKLQAQAPPIFHKAKYGYVNSKYESIFVSSVLDKSSKPDYEELLRAMNEQEPHDKN